MDPVFYSAVISVVVIILLLALACVSIAVVLVKVKHSKCRYLGGEGEAGKGGREAGMEDRWTDGQMERQKRQIDE